MELFSNYNTELVKPKYRTWIFILSVPAGLLLLIEFYLGWPAPEYEKPQYFRVMVGVVVVLAVFILITWGLSYWHFRKNRTEKTLRNIHAWLAIFLMCGILALLKIDILQSFFSRDELVTILHSKVPSSFYLDDQFLETIRTIEDVLGISFVTLQSAFLMYIIGRLIVRKIKTHRSKFNEISRKIY